MTNVNAALLYFRVGRIAFDGSGDALDFINTIEARTRIGYTDYQRIMIVELSIQAAAQDWFMQTIQPSMTTMTWLEFKERFLRYFYPASMRDNYRWQLLYIARGERTVEEYTREFFRLSHHVVNVMQDERRAVELYVTRLGPAYIGIQTKD